MKKIIGLLLCLVCSITFAQQFSPGLNERSLDGRNYDVITPSNYNPTNQYDVVFFLHGLGGDRTSFRNQAAVDALQIIAVLPEATMSSVPGVRMWNSFSFSPPMTNNSQDVFYIENLTQELDVPLAHYNFRDRMFLMGASNGGSMALKIARENSIFRAYSIYAMSAEVGDVVPGNARKVPILFTQGINDTVIPYQGGAGNIYGVTAGNFSGLQATANQWALHNTGGTQSMDIKYQEPGKPVNYFREFRDLTNKVAPVYVYAIEGQGHVTSGLFDPINVVTASVRFFRAPLCFGLSRKHCEQNNIVR